MFLLRKLKVKEISLVDKPANSGARIVLLKREVETPSAAEVKKADFKKRAEDLLDRLAKEGQAREGLTYEAAYAKAVMAHPALVECTF